MDLVLYLVFRLYNCVSHELYEHVQQCRDMKAQHELSGANVPFPMHTSQ